MDESGEPILSDFGLSRFRHAISRIDTLRITGGIRPYVAPELLHQDRPLLRSTEPTDIFALGVLSLKLGAPNHQYFAGTNPAVGTLLKTAHQASTLGSLGSQQSTFLWKLLTLSWNSDPSKRITTPHMAHYTSKLQKHVIDGGPFPLSPRSQKLPRLMVGSEAH